MKIKLIYLLLILVITFTTTSYSKDTEVITHPDQSESLEAKWNWAMQQVDQFSDGVWIGYSIKRMMQKNSYTGIYLSGDDKFNYPTIEQIIYQRNIDNLETESLSEAAQNALTEFDKKHSNSDNNQLVEKEVAILFFFDNNSSAGETFDLGYPT